MEQKYVKGRGAQFNSANRFEKDKLVFEHFEGLDEAYVDNNKTEYINIFPKTLINKVESTDLFMEYSINAYQGCEHGCIYCYARPTHEYWGYSAGLDFESKILVKQNAPELLKHELMKKNYQTGIILMSGNTDCYQPCERKFGITRELLKVLLKHGNPISIITKNTLIERDIDLLEELAKRSLVHVTLSITSLDESLRLLLEPRTATYKRKIVTIQKLSEKNIPVHVLVAPIIPALNDQEIPKILEEVAAAGALDAHYSLVRLNGPVGDLFVDWVFKNMPLKAEKVLNQIKNCHGGNLHDYRQGTRMNGEGKMAEAIKNLFQISKKKYFNGRELPILVKDQFISNPYDGQMRLF